MNDLSPQAKALLRAARSFDDPSDDDHRRVRSSVLSRVGAGAAIGLAATMSTSTLAASTGAILTGTVAKIGMAVLLAGGLSTGAYFATHARSAPRPAMVETIKTAPQPTLPGMVPAAATDAPAAAIDDSTKSVEGESPAPRAARTKGHATPRAGGDIEGEVHLLEEADADLRRGDATGALARLGEHATKYPGGALRQERDGMNVVALCQAGRQTEGRAAAERFLSRGSKSALASRIRAACGIPRAE
jgi:hypothetical protein